jgi:hypothetical protein
MNEMQAPIPKRIIQTANSTSQSLRVQAMMSNIRLLNPDYEYRFYDSSARERFVREEFPQYQTIFDSFHAPIQQVDFFRYLAIYRHGGFYFDLDVIFKVGLSGLCKYGCVFPFEGFTYSRLLRKQYQMDWEVGNYGFGAAAGHPFIEAVIENCIRAQREPSWVDSMLRGTPRFSRSQFRILYSTGPGLVSRTFAENRALAKSVMVLFPDDVCDSAKWNCFGDYGVHLMDGSWRPKMGRARARLLGELEAWQWRKVVKESAALGKTRSHLFTEDLSVDSDIQEAFS